MERQRLKPEHYSYSCRRQSIARKFLNKVRDISWCRGGFGIDRAGPKIDSDNPASPKQGISSIAHAFADLHRNIDSVRNLRSSRLVLRNASQFCDSGVPEVSSRPGSRANSTGLVLLCCCRTLVVPVSVCLVAQADIFAEKSFLDVRQVSELAGVNLRVDAFRR